MRSSPTLSRHLGAVQDEVTLEDCWPSDELTLQWLKLGREKMDAFQAALRWARAVSQVDSSDGNEGPLANPASCS